MPRISKKYNLDLNRIRFEIAMTFPEGDPDAIIANLSQLVPHFHDMKGKNTPNEITVAKFLAILFNKDLNDKNMNIPIEERLFGKAEVCATEGLMQNFCSITFEVDLDSLENMAELQEIIDNCKKVMRSHAKIIRYYKDKTKVGHFMGICSFG